MTRRIRHRGPDDWGAWADSEAGIGLGHARLSIIDLSPGGHQPMASTDGRFQIVFNGEIYNFQDLRAELETHGCAFRSHSDTEVLLAAISAWGLKSAAKKFVGMFAFGLWDARERRLHLVRDRFGEKPLYWTQAGAAIGFASELKSFKGLPGFETRISPEGQSLFMEYGYVPAPYSIYENTYKVLPGEILSFRMADGRPVVAERERYWDLEKVALDGLASPFRGSLEDAVDAVEELLGASVRRQMVADVPLGAFLSGGVDSSLTTALMQRHSSRKIRTFSIGFEWEAFNEAIYAKRVADHLGTDHSEMYVTSEHARRVIPSLPEIYDEPFADSSQIPTLLLCQMVRKDVTVALTGDGADETFFGYSRYVRAMQARSFLSKLPRPLQGVLAATHALQRALGFGSRFTPSRRSGGVLKPWETLRRRGQYLIEMCGSGSQLDAYRKLLRPECDPRAMVGVRRVNAQEAQRTPVFGEFPNLLMYADTRQYLSDDILVKVDRASMSVGLETRVPFLDHRLCEFSWTLPFDYKYHPSDGGGKRVLKKLLERHIPEDWIYRKKQGFSVPLVHWLRTDLREWAESLLDPARLKDSGFVNVGKYLENWNAYQKNEREIPPYLWSVLMYQSWRQTLGSGTLEEA